MTSALWLFAPAAVLTALASWWIARAFVRGGPGARPAPVLIGCLAGAAATLGLYLALGAPNLADAPYAPRLAELEARVKTAPLTMAPDELLAVLDARAKADPKDARPLIFAADILASEGRDAEAARRYQAALKLDPDSPHALIGLGRASVKLDGGVVAPGAKALFQRAAVLAPDDPTPWLYQAMAAGQEGRTAEAAQLWAEVRVRLAPDDPRRAMAEAMSKGAGAKTPQQQR